MLQGKNIYYECDVVSSETLDMCLCGLVDFEVQLNSIKLHNYTH